MDEYPVIVLEFPYDMIDREFDDIHQRTEMMRNTRSGLNTHEILWPHLMEAIATAMTRVEYRDIINEYYRNADIPTWEAVAADGEVFSWELDFKCIGVDHQDYKYICDVIFEDPKLAMLIKLAAKTVKNNNEFH